jgi:phage terminase large subunit
LSTSGAIAVDRRSRGASHRSPFAALAEVAERSAAKAEVITWPSARWRNDPVGFARNVLGIELWTAQVAILEAIRDNRNTTVRSGHKCGKSTALAVAALWFYCSFPRARVVMTAVKASQIDEVIWKEVRRLHREAKIPVGGELYALARSGLRDAADDRQVWGITARDGEGLAGISGPNVLVLTDEASGIPDRFFEVLGSSLAGSGGTARKCYISNPTRTTGEFYRSHTTNAHMFKCLHVSSEDTPNARGTGMIPGLAGREWIAEKRLEYGEDSAAYKVRVLGEFVHDKDGKIISLDLIAAAEAAWDEAPEAGDLQIGIDPAGDGILGDETAIAVRRGGKIVTVLTWRGQTEDAIVAHAMGLLGEHRRRAVVGTPRIAVDVEGGIGTRVMAKLRVAIESASASAALVEVRGGKKLWGSPDYDMVRDGLWGQAFEWIKAGGALPADVKLAQDLNAPTFTADKNRRYVATDKKALRKILGRSPDRADAVCLAIWGYASVDAGGLEAAPLDRGGDAYETTPGGDAYDVVGGGGDSVYG